MSKGDLKTLFILFLIVAICTSCNFSPQDASPTSKEHEKSVSNQTKNSSSIKVTLLGTGSPIISQSRYSATTLVEAGGEKLLFDAGRGVNLRLNAIDIKPGEINKQFLTHLHSDHLVGLPDLFLTGVLASQGMRKKPFKVWGPKGTKQMMSNLKESFKADLQSRSGTVTIEAHDIKQGVVFEKNDVKVTAFLVDHKSIKPAFGYRVDYKGHSVTISGDTTYSPNLIDFAKGTDVLIHEVAFARSEDLKKSKALRSILSIHTTPKEAGKVFSQVKPGLAVYSHIVLLGGVSEEADLVGRTKETYEGKVVVGEDLTTIEIGDKITVNQH